VAAAIDAIISSDNQPQCFSAKSSVNCELRKLHHSERTTSFSLLELKSARTIISLLREDINKANAPKATNLPKPSILCGSSGYEQAVGKWIPVVHSFNKRKKMPTVTSMSTEQSYVSSNRFTPLTNLNENDADEVNLTSNCK